MAKNSKRTSTLRRRTSNRTETKAAALDRTNRLSFVPMPALVVARPTGRNVTVEVFDTRGRCGIEGTSLTFSDPNAAAAFLAIG